MEMIVETPPAKPKRQPGDSQATGIFTRQALEEAFPPQDPADILDPAVPPEALEPPPAVGAPAEPSSVHAYDALLHGFCTALQGKLHAWLLEESTTFDRHLDKMLVFLKDWGEQTGKANEHACYQLSDALAKLCEHGLGSLGAPYQATIQAISPAGFPITLQLAKQDPVALVGALESVHQWLASAQYRPAGRLSEPDPARPPSGVLQDMQPSLVPG
jgi:hypothetical protein